MASGDALYMWQVTLHNQAVVAAAGGDVQGALSKLAIIVSGSSPGPEAILGLAALCCQPAIALYDAAADLLAMHPQAAPQVPDCIYNFMS